MAAIAIFEKTIDRANALVNLRRNLTDEQLGNIEHPDDLLRAALAITVAAMDGYFTDRFSESLISFLKKKGPTEGMVTLLLKAGLDTKAALEMLPIERPYRRVRNIIERYLSDYTTQKPNVIDQLFAPYGIKNLSVNAQGLAKKKNLITSVTKAVNRRHAIVHGGDLNSHDRVTSISTEVTQKYVADVSLYVHKCEELIEKVFKPQKKAAKVAK